MDWDLNEDEQKFFEQFNQSVQHAKTHSEPATPDCPHESMILSDEGHEVCMDCGLERQIIDDHENMKKRVFTVILKTIIYPKMWSKSPIRIMVLLQMIQFCVVIHEKA
jgi:hypothetical protein